MSVTLRTNVTSDAAVLEPAPQDVEGDPVADVPDVRRSLDGEPAQVDRRLAGFERLEGPQRPGRGVVEVQAHRPIVGSMAGSDGRAQHD